MESTAPNFQLRTRRQAIDGRLLLLAATAAALVVPLAYSLAFRGKVYPGVYAGGVHLGGQTPAQALDALAGSGFDPAAPVELSTVDARWDVPAADLGVTFDPLATAADAFAVGRHGNRAQGTLDALTARLRGREIAPAMAVDEVAARHLLGQLADAYDRPAIDAGFSVDGASVIARDSTPGRALDVEAGVTAVTAAVRAGAWPLQVTVPSQAIDPTITDAAPAMRRVHALLDGPITLALGEDASWTLPPEDLAPLLLLQQGGDGVNLSIDTDALGAWLEPVRGTVATPPENPRFTFDEESGELRAKKPGHAGEALDVDTTAQRILAVATTGQRRVDVALTATAPDFPNTVAGSKLGITALLREETSHFVGSPAARIHNIGLAADRFDGVLIPPGATFSFNQQLGDVTAELGYKETLIIMDGTTADGVGGGVCQVSTTLFRTAFWSGLPIVERHAHGYRVAYYEQGSVPPGLDATIYSPAVDLKFRNDTDSWMLIESATDPAKKTLTFKLYGQPTGREVEIEGPVISRQVPAPAGRVEVDPDLAAGETRTLEYARSGADVSVTRIVRQDGQEVRDTFNSRYRPTGEVVAVSPDSPEAAQAAEAAGVDSAGEQLGLPEEPAVSDQTSG